MRSVARELIRRRVVRAGAAYAAVSFVALQLGEILLPAFGVGPGGLRSMFAGLLAGGPLVLAATWVYDAGGSGTGGPARRPGTAERRHTASVPSKRKMLVVLCAAGLVGGLGWWLVAGGLDRATPTAGLPSIVLTAAVLLVAVGWSLWDGVYPDAPHLAAGDSSIAVLPFANWGTMGDRAFLGDALADDVRDQLGAIGGIRVAARSSSLESATPPSDARRVGRALGVRSLLEGSVLHSESVTRVTAQLIDTQTGFRVWSGTYAYPPDALPDDGTEIARVIVTNMLAAAECRRRLRRASLAERREAPRSVTG